MNNFFVYMLCNPIKNDEPFYVGKGKGRRPYSHIRQAKSGYKSHKCSIIRKILFAELEVNIKYIDLNLSENDAYELEEFLINEIGRHDLNMGTLTNVTNGGEGTSGHKHTQEYKDNHSKILSGRKKSDHMKLALSEYHKKNPEKNPMKNEINVLKNTGVNHWTSKIENFIPHNKGIPMSDEQKSKLSLSTTGDKHWNFGNKHSPETISKMTGKVRSEETKEKMRKPKNRYECKCCGKMIAPNIFYKYHNDNCKENNE